MNTIEESYLYILALKEILPESYEVRDVTTKNGTRTMISAEAAVRRARELAGKGKVTVQHLQSAIKELTDNAKQNLKSAIK